MHGGKDGKDCDAITHSGSGSRDKSAWEQMAYCLLEAVTAERKVVYGYDNIFLSMNV
jgi:hypothetical protein